jgi:hypothetical protein
MLEHQKIGTSIQGIANGISGTKDLWGIVKGALVKQEAIRSKFECLLQILRGY